MVLEIGSHVTTMTEIYTIMTKVHYRLSNGAGSKKEILVCGLVPAHARCYGCRHICVCNIPVLPCLSPTNSKASSRQQSTHVEDLTSMATPKALSEEFTAQLTCSMSLYSMND